MTPHCPHCGQLIQTQVEAVAPQLSPQPVAEAALKTQATPTAAVDPHATAADPFWNLWGNAVSFVRREGRVSLSALQDEFCLNHYAACSFIERMECEGIITPPLHTGKRKVIG